MDEEQQSDRPPAIGTYDTDPHLTEAERKAEEERAEREQDTAETDEGGE